MCSSTLSDTGSKVKAPAPKASAVSNASTPFLIPAFSRPLVKSAKSSDDFPEIFEANLVIFSTSLLSGLPSRNLSAFEAIESRTPFTSILSCFLNLFATSEETFAISFVASSPRVTANLLMYGTAFRTDNAAVATATIVATIVLGCCS